MTVDQTPDLAARFAGVRARIAAAAEQCDRDLSGITLIAISKTHPASVVKELIERGTITLEDGLAFATNQNNLLLELKGVTAAEEFMQREGNGVPLATVSESGSMRGQIDSWRQ